MAVTGLIFDQASHKVIGKQNKNGTIDQLTDDDIETCNKYKFPYVLPQNLNSNSKNSASVEGLDDDEEDVEVDVINETEELLDEEEDELLEEGDEDDGDDFLDDED